MVRVIGATVQKNSKRIWGKFKLSDGSVTQFEQTLENAKNGISWFQWGNTTGNLGLTVDKVERLVSEWLKDKV